MPRSHRHSYHHVYAQMTKLLKGLQGAYLQGPPKVWIQTAFQRLFKHLSATPSQDHVRPMADITYMTQLFKGLLPTPLVLCPRSETVPASNRLTAIAHDIHCVHTAYALLLLAHCTC